MPLSRMLDGSVIPHGHVSQTKVPKRRAGPGSFAREDGPRRDGWDRLCQRRPGCRFSFALSHVCTNFQTRGARGSARLDASMYLKHVLVAPGLSVLGRRPPSPGRCLLLAQPRALRAALTPFDSSPHAPGAPRGMAVPGARPHSPPGSHGPPAAEAASGRVSGRAGTGRLVTLASRESQVGRRSRAV